MVPSALIEEDEAVMDEVPRRKLWLFPVLMTEHVFDKARLLDIGLAELEILLEGGEVIEEVAVAEGSKETVLLVPWHRPLHAVVVVDVVHSEERLITVYQPDPNRWNHDFKRRR